jgi:hypothetical protein
VYIAANCQFFNFSIFNAQQAAWRARENQQSSVMKRSDVDHYRMSLNSPSYLLRSHIFIISEKKNNINCQLFVINKQELGETVAEASIERHTDLLSGQLNKLKYIYGLI